MRHIIAKNVDGQYLILEREGSAPFVDVPQEGDMGIKADPVNGVRQPPIPFQRHLKFGVWDDAEHDEELLLNLMMLPELPRHPARD